MTVEEALQNYREAILKQSNAKSEACRAETALENAVLEALGEDGFVPSADSDAVTVICGTALVTLLARDRRPAVSVEDIPIVS